jgi:hypothetical protein
MNIEEKSKQNVERKLVKSKCVGTKRKRTSKFKSRKTIRKSIKNTKCSSKNMRISAKVKNQLFFLILS